MNKMKRNIAGKNHREKTTAAQSSVLLDRLWSVWIPNWERWIFILLCLIDWQFIYKHKCVFSIQKGKKRKEKKDINGAELQSMQLQSAGFPRSCGLFMQQHWVEFLIALCAVLQLELGLYTV